jgi:hypothetical protein
MAKSLVFISHITAEAEVAIEFKSLIETHFLGLIDVFVSSDGQTIQMGQKWLNSISAALKNCSVEIVICSPMSVKRPWISFEAGAGWVRDIPVIPLCHSGMTPSDLPVPLNMLQAAKLTDISGLKLVFPVLATALGAKTPQVDFTQFVQKVAEFETRYTFWEKCNSAFQDIDRLDAHIIPTLKAGQPVVLDLTDVQLNQIKPAIDFLTAEGVLDFRRVGNTKFTPLGTFYDFRLAPATKFGQIASDPNWKWK